MPNETIRLDRRSRETISRVETGHHAPRFARDGTPMQHLCSTMAGTAAVAAGTSERNRLSAHLQARLPLLLPVDMTQQDLLPQLVSSFMVWE